MKMRIPNYINNATKLLQTKESDGNVVKLIKIRRRENKKKVKYEIVNEVQTSI